jgi:hypothetical protein
MEQFFNFIEILKQFGLEWYHKYYSVYPGVVEEVDDPDQLGRIKVSLPSLLAEGEVIDTWCEPCGQAIAGDQSGAFFPPYEGDIVDVIFENGDIHYPRYLGGSWGDDELPSDFVDGYDDDGVPQVRGWYFASKQKLLFDETDAKNQITLNNGDTDQELFIDGTEDAPQITLNNGESAQEFFIDGTPSAPQMSMFNGDTGAMMILDDTPGSEIITLVHKTGSQMQFTQEGNIIFATAGGNLVFLNDVTGEVTVTSQAGSVVSLSDTIVASDASGGNIVTVTDSTVEVTSSGDVIVTGQNINLNAGNINIGNGADDNAVLYSKLADLFDNHLHATALGPSGPPIPPNTFAITGEAPPLSAKAGNVKLKGNL